MQIIGHRGARGLWPENTLGGFSRAMNAGVKSFELDVGITKDKIVVVTHDPELNPDITRYKDGSWFWSEAIGFNQHRIQFRNYIDLHQYKIGQINPDSEYAKQFPNQQPIEEQHIPALADVLTLVCDRAAVTIEVKSFPDQPERTIPAFLFVQALKKVLDEVTAPWDDITISSFDWQIIDEVHAQIPGIPIAALTENTEKQNTSIMHRVKSFHAKIWSPEYTDLNQSLIDEAHSIGLKVVTWTVNDPASIELLEKMGVDGVITDYPCKFPDLTL